MSFNLKTFSAFIGAAVESCDRLRPDFGLSITMQDVFNLSSICQRDEEGLHNKHLCDLTKTFGVVVFYNAYVEIFKPVGLSNHRTSKGELLQDFFHADTPLGPDSVTILTKKPGTIRNAPTLYTRISDVRHALGRISTSGDSAQVQAAIKAMNSESYRFTLEPRDMWARGIILHGYPSLTEQVASMIPDEKIYAHYWGTNDRAIVLHSPGFKPDFLHARPTSDDRYNTVSAAKLLP